MTFSFDNTTTSHVPIGSTTSTWESTARSIMERRRSSTSVNTTNINDSRRNSLLSLSMFDMPLFGFGGGNNNSGGGGTLSARNSLGLGGGGAASSLFSHGLSDTDPFAPYAFNDISMLPLTRAELQQMQLLQQQQQHQQQIQIQIQQQQQQQQQNNDTISAALLNLTNHGALRRGSFGFSSAFSGFGGTNFGGGLNNAMTNATSAIITTTTTTTSVLDRLLGDRSESSGETIPTVATASTTASSTDSSATSSDVTQTASGSSNHHKHQHQHQQQQHSQHQTMQNAETFHQLFRGEDATGSDNDPFTAASIFQHFHNNNTIHNNSTSDEQQQQQQQQQQRQQRYQRRTSLGLYDMFPRNDPITHLGSSATGTLSPDDITAQKPVLLESTFGLSGYGPLSNNKQSLSSKASIRSSPATTTAKAFALDDDDKKHSATLPSKSNATRMVTSSTTMSDADDGGACGDNGDNDDDDCDDDDDDNINRFKPFHEEKWSLRYKELLDFHREHSHAAVPHTYPPNPQLARWVKRQRRQFKLRNDSRQSTMTTERLDLLNDVGFIWDSHDVNWREKLDSLMNFKLEHKHCNVPSNYRDKKLATWVKCQRRQYKLFWDGKPSAMTQQRIQELEKVGFEWEIRSTVSRPSTSALNLMSTSTGSSSRHSPIPLPLGINDDILTSQHSSIDDYQPCENWV